MSSLSSYQATLVQIWTLTVQLMIQVLQCPFYNKFFQVLLLKDLLCQIKLF